jgi:Fe-S-cluster containining protein
MHRKNESARQNNFFDICIECRGHLSCCFSPKPPITRERKRRIEAYLEKEKVPVANTFARAEYVFPRENAEGYCGFYKVATATCLVHSVKPETCVAGPITFDIDKQSIGDRLHRHVEDRFSSEKHLGILDNALKTL